MEFEKIKVVGIFGAGLMGHGIAQVMVQQGYQVVMRDIKPEFLEIGLNGIKKGIQKFAEKGVITEAQAKTALSLIRTTTDIKEAAKEADFVIEAIPEKIELKKELFKQLDETCKEDAIFASNTSTLSITEMAAATRRPQKIIGMHFFNPVPLMKLVEVVKGLLTSPETIELTKKLAIKLGKEPIVVTDSPGFATSRLGIAIYLEAHKMLDEGTASIDDIDRGMRLGYAHRMGPFETCDLVGLDARLNNLNAMYEMTRDPMWRVPQLLKKLVMSGFLGKKPGSKGGYYTYFGLEK